MTTVGQATPLVNRAGRARRGPGQPSKQTLACICTINRSMVEAALSRSTMPSHVNLAEALHLSERTVRAIRLQVLGLNRHELKRWQGRPCPSKPSDEPVERELICATPFAGLWLLVPQILDSGLARAAETCRSSHALECRPTRLS